MAPSPLLLQREEGLSAKEKLVEQNQISVKDEAWHFIQKEKTKCLN
jgi:hypothetical protein